MEVTANAVGVVVWRRTITARAGAEAAVAARPGPCLKAEVGVVACNVHLGPLQSQIRAIFPAVRRDLQLDLPRSRMTTERIK